MHKDTLRALFRKYKIGKDAQIEFQQLFDDVFASFGDYGDFLQTSNIQGSVLEEDSGPIDSTIQEDQTGEDISEEYTIDFNHNSSYSNPSQSE